MNNFYFTFKGNEYMMSPIGVSVYFFIKTKVYRKKSTTSLWSGIYSEELEQYYIRRRKLERICYG